MSGETRGTGGTIAEDYTASYYQEGHLGGEGDYSWDDGPWRNFFEMAADRIVAISNPASVLDVGAAKGMLVQALRARGVDARGFDLSDHAVATAHPDVRDHLWVASATDELEGTYSLVTCIEVLEHMAPADAQAAIDRMCAVTDLVLFSSSPDDHAEPTHVGTRPTATWATWFAERGFFRRVDVDLSFLTPWAVLLERAELPARALVQRYEQQYAQVNTELVAKRSALLEAHREISALQQEGPASADLQALVHKWEAEVLEARHQLLTTRDHVVGTEAQVSQLARDNARLNRELVRSRKQLATVRAKLASTRQRANRLARRLERARSAPARVVPPPSVAQRAVRRLRGGSR